ncbi:MAG: hypothetical protein HUU46_20415 [Candidatus Hydrogenedentes bacterium]|nr:hypothetical protein [Candidatus Hydrogenedentota bacterium]
MRVNRILGIAAVIGAAGLLGLSAIAQPPGGPGGLPGLPGMEELAKAWEPQAATVAKSLSLDDAKTKQLTDAYKASREALSKAAIGQMAGGGQGGPGGGRGEAYRKLITDERAKLDAKLKEFLTPEQTASALAVLGTYSIQWDGMVNSLNALGLDDKVKTDAMNAVAGFIGESGKAREAAAGDRDVVRQKMSELRSKLEADLGKILSAEQVTKLKEMPGFRQGRGGPRDGGLGSGRPRPDALGQGAPAPATPPAEGSEKKDN